MNYRVNVYCNSVKPTCYYVESSHSRALDRIAQLKIRFKHLNSITFKVCFNSDFDVT